MKDDPVRECAFAMTSTGPTLLPGPHRFIAYLLLALALGGCAGSSGSGARYDPFRCDRNGDESQRRSC